MQHTRILRYLCATAGVITVAATQPTAHAENLSFSIYGFTQVDAIFDTKRVDPDWEDAFRPSRIPIQPGVFGSDGHSSYSVKQSRIGVQGTAPVNDKLGDINFKFEIDLFGVGADAGLTTIRARHIYGEWGPLLAGLTNSVFMDMDAFPNVIDYWGPNGMVFYRNVQIRLTPYRTEHSHFAIALERPGNDVDPGNIRELDPGVATNLQSDEKLPDLTAHWYTSDTWGHFQVAGILRRLGFDTKGTPGNKPKGSEFGWGISAGGHANLFERDRLIAQVTYGHGIASYINDGGTDLAPSGTPTDVHSKAVPLLGSEFYYNHYWDKDWSSAIGYSFTQVDNTSQQSPDAFKKGEYASINLLYEPAKNLMIGGEAMWGKRTDNNGATGDDMRFQFSVKYSFGAQLTL